MGGRAGTGAPGPDSNHAARGTPVAHTRKVTGEFQRASTLHQEKKEKKQRTVTRSRSLRDARQLQRDASAGYPDHLSPATFYLTLLAGVAAFAAAITWVVVISWDPKQQQ